MRAENPGPSRAACSRVDTIKQRGSLVAGVSLGFAGFSRRDDASGQWRGFDVDVARAVAVAIFGDVRPIRFVPLPSSDRFARVADGTIDVGSFNASITFSREVQHDVRFLGPMLYDGEALLARRRQLRGAGRDVRALGPGRRRIAALRGSTTEENLIRYFQAIGLDCEVLLHGSPDEARRAYEDGPCDLYCLDSYLLAGERSRLARPDEHEILSDVISREAMAPAVSNADGRWAAAVSWILRSLVEAEELGLTSAGVDAAAPRPGTYLHRFLNPAGELCEALGLPPGFTRKVVRLVGNYGEIFARNLGDRSPLGLSRRENQLRSRGGLLFSPLFI